MSETGIVSPANPYAASFRVWQQAISVGTAHTQSWKRQREWPVARRRDRQTNSCRKYLLAWGWGQLQEKSSL